MKTQFCKKERNFNKCMFIIFKKLSTLIRECKSHLQESEQKGKVIIVWQHNIIVGKLERGKKKFNLSKMIQ